MITYTKIKFLLIVSLAILTILMIYTKPLPLNLNIDAYVISNRTIVETVETTIKLLCIYEKANGSENFELDRFPPQSFGLLNENIEYNIRNPGIRNGGHWFPSDCQPTTRIAIIIPYRNREDNLKAFLYNMHPFLQQQNLNYSIYVVEQVNNQSFNKGILMNSGFSEIIDKRSSESMRMLGSYQYDCVVFHDVDLLPTGFSKSKF